MAIPTVAVGDKITAAQYNSVVAIANAVGELLILPTSVAVGSGSTSTSSLGTVTFTAASTVSLNGVFSAAYSHYKLVFAISSASLAGISLVRLRSSGSDDATANYNGVLRQHVNTNGTTSTTTTPITGQTSLSFSGSGVAHFGELHVWNPAVALASRFSTAPAYSANSGNIHIDASASGALGTTNLYDGFTLLPGAGGTLTGTVTVFGFAN